jgi:hypothetical protein
MANFIDLCSSVDGGKKRNREKSKGESGEKKFSDSENVPGGKWKIFRKTLRLTERDFQFSA